MTSFDESFLSKYRRGTSGYHPSQDTDFTNLSGSPLSNRKTPHKSVDQNLDFKLSQLKVNYQKSKREKQTFVIGVCGGSASGKTTVCRKIIETLDNKKVVVLSQDSFYKSLTEEQKEQANRAEYDFDHPGKCRTWIHHFCAWNSLYFVLGTLLSQTRISPSEHECF